MVTAVGVIHGALWCVPDGPVLVLSLLQVHDRAYVFLTKPAAPGPFPPLTSDDPHCQHSSGQGAVMTWQRLRGQVGVSCSTRMAAARATTSEGSEATAVDKVTQRGRQGMEAHGWNGSSVSSGSSPLLCNAVCARAKAAAAADYRSRPGHATVAAALLDARWGEGGTARVAVVERSTVEGVPLTGIDMKKGDTLDVLVGGVSD